MPNYQVAFFDIDGTLADNALPRELGIYGRIPESAKRALSQLKEQGIEPVIASGRNYQMIADFAQLLGVDSVISSNGTFVTFQGKEIASHYLETELVTEMIQSFQAAKMDFLLETTSELSTTKQVSRCRKMFCNFCAIAPRRSCLSWIERE